MIIWLFIVIVILVPKLCQILLQPYGLVLPPCLLCPWDFSGKNTGVACHFLLQAIFPTQGSNPHLLHFSPFFTAKSPGKPIFPLIGQNNNNNKKKPFLFPFLSPLERKTVGWILEILLLTKHLYDLFINTGL